ncbi:hypothetical protein IAT38_005441 [Cryptococcus sp. DSM 104549]
MLAPLLVGAAALAPLAQAYYVDSEEYTSGALGSAPVQTFESVNFTAAAWNFNVYPNSTSSLQSGYLFLAPRGTDVETPTAIIYDANGEVVFHGVEFGIGQTMAFTTGTYQGEQVMLAWEGSFNSNGYGSGYGLVYDSTYTVIANVTSAIDGTGIDFHEFALTDNNTALATIYINEEYDLSAWNVSATDGTSGWILGGAFQETDVATGDAIFTWKSLDHVTPSDCYTDPGTTGVSENSPWDYFHINSIEKDASGNYLISSRHCHAIYQISASTGEILWSINGKNTNFTMGDGTTFEWQHDARWRNNYTQISLFNNAATSWESDEDEASGLLLNVDQSAMAVTLAQNFLPWNATVAKSQGSMELQENGNWLLGWGQNPYWSEYTADGTLLASVQFGVGNVQGYRAIRSDWVGYPTTTPALAVSTNSSTSGYDVYTSWNGATEVSQWVLLGYTSTSDNASSSTLNQLDKSTFETHFSLDSNVAASFPWVQTKAVSSNGSVLGYSDFVALNGSGSVAASESQSSQVTVGTAVASSATSSSATASTSAGSNNLSSGAEKRVFVGLGAIVAACGVSLLL